MTSYVVPDETPGGWDDRTAGDGDFVTDVLPQMRTVVVECEDSARHRLAMQLGQSVFDYDTVSSFAAELGPTPTVVVFGPSFAAPSLLHEAVQVIRDRSEVGAILVADELTTDLFQQAIRSGIRDVLASPVDTAQLQEACRRVADSVGSVGRSIGAIDGDPGGDGDEGVGDVVGRQLVAPAGGRCCPAQAARRDIGDLHWWCSSESGSTSITTPSSAPSSTMSAILFALRSGLVDTTTAPSTAR